MDEKQLLYQFLGREIDSIIDNICPGLHIISGTIKNYLFNYIDPYVDIFFMGGKQLNTTAVKDYATKEVTDKIKDFVKKYEDERDTEIKRKSKPNEN